MTLRRTSILLPCQHLESFPTHLGSPEAAELLAGWTALWHPALISATGQLPGWHPADNPPDPSELIGELVVVPPVSRLRLPGDWCDRLRATAPKNPPPVESLASREQTVAAVLAVASLAGPSVAAEMAADFLALGYAHLQVELLTRAMRYSTVLDKEQFSNAVVTAARAALAGNEPQFFEELGRAFDLLADARNHVYSVDFYLVEVTLLAATTLGESLRAKLATRTPCSLLASGQQLKTIAREHPQTLAELRAAIDAGSACVVSGAYDGTANEHRSLETLLAELQKTQRIVTEQFGHECEVFGQFHSAFSLCLPQILAGSGCRAALHTCFDGGRLPRPEQCKTRWGERDGAWVEALAATPRDLARPETWLKFAEYVGDSLAHDHVATVLLAGWPGQSCDYHDDIRRSAKYNPVLGKLVTLEEYFRITRETDDWTSFAPREYPQQSIPTGAANPISTRVDDYRRDAHAVYERLADGLAAIAASAIPTANQTNDNIVPPTILNPWNFSCSRFLDSSLIEPAELANESTLQAPRAVAEIPGCGFAQPQPTPAHGVLLADGHMLRNELLELTVSATTGSIQALRTHRDRSTRVSQRLVFHRHRAGHETPALDSQMVAEQIEITRNDGVLGEITSRGQLLDAAGQPLARFTQAVRLARGLPAAIVDVQLDPETAPDGEIWNSYFASRLAWADEAVSFRRGLQWQARETDRERIESPEFVEISNGVGTIVCFGLGLPFHRRASVTWLDTLLCVAGEERRRFQFALGLDCTYPSQTALALLTADVAPRANLPSSLSQPRGWFLHVGAQNLLITHLEALSGERTGIRCRILETEGRAAETTLSAYRPFTAARTTDFRGEADQLLSVVEGQAKFTIGPHHWLQLEAEW